jgi:hypothetical protein
MNGELPLVAVAGAGSALLAGIHLYERRADEAMRASRVRLALTFPSGLDPVNAKAALAGLAGQSDRLEFIFEVAASEDGVRHALLVPAAARDSVVATLSGAMPGLRVADAAPIAGRATFAAKLHVPTPTVLATDQAEAAVRTLLSGIAGLAPGEHAVMRVALRPAHPRAWSSPNPPDRAAREAERLWRQKSASGVGFTVAGLLLTRAASVARAHEICEHLTSSLRSRRGPVGVVRLTTERGSRSLGALPKTTRSSGWLTPAELLSSLLGWPLGDEVIPGVEVGASRQLRVPRYVPRTGRPLFLGHDFHGERVVAQDATARIHHTAIIASTGGGKSSAFMRWVLADMASGAGGVVLDPKNDLVNDLLERVPPEYADRVVVLDPSQPGPVPGLELFGAGDPDLRSDVILSALRSVYKDAWGVRIDAMLRAGLRALAELDQPMLSDWIRIFTEPAFRARAIARLDDPILIQQWRSFEALSAAEQVQHITPALSRITGLLTRPALRNVINQPNPRLSISELLDRGHWLFVSLAPGALSEAASAVLSAVLGYLLWTAIEARVTVPADQRRPAFFYCDELASLHLPVGLERFLERARGMNCGLVLALQDLTRLSPAAQSSLLVNSGTVLSFKASADAAARLAREMPPLSARDLTSLGRFEIAGRVHTGSHGPGSVTLTGRTEGPPPTTGQAERIRALSAERYGRDPQEIEQALRDRSAGSEGMDSGSYGRTGRAA